MPRITDLYLSSYFPIIDVFEIREENDVSGPGIIKPPKYSKSLEITSNVVAVPISTTMLPVLLFRVFINHWYH